MDSLQCLSDSSLLCEVWCRITHSKIIYRYIRGDWGCYNTVCSLCPHPSHGCCSLHFVHWLRTEQRQKKSHYHNQPGFPGTHMQVQKHKRTRHRKRIMILLRVKEKDRSVKDSPERLREKGGHIWAKNRVSRVLVFMTLACTNLPMEHTSIVIKSQPKWANSRKQSWHYVYLAIIHPSKIQNIRITQWWCI